MQRFQDYVCVVTGATRGIGRGIALGLGELGAIVYITGRTAKPTGSKVGGSLEETAAEINFRGGKAIPVVVDHADEKQVTSLFEQVRREQRGRLDVLVNNVYAAVPFLGANDGKAYYEIDSCTPGEAWDIVNNAGLRNHYICSTLATRLMLKCRKQTEGLTNPGLIVNVSSIGARRYLFNACYGIAIPVVVDHADEKQVTSLFEQVRREQRGRLDVLVNNVYAAVPFLGANDGKAYYEIDSCTPGEAWDIVNNAGLRNHYICSTLATRLMLKCRKQTEGLTNPGLIVNVSSIGARRYLFNACYGVGKAALDRMTADMSVELKRNGANVCVISLWPGLVRTEELMNQAGNLSSDHILSKMDPSVSESTELTGRAVAALLAESPDQLMARSGQIVLVSDVAAAYGIREPDGTTPPNLRSIQLLMRLTNHTTLARFIPGFIRLPKSLFFYLMSSS
ncbi:hypothetical protein EG68_11317 [Paragonimus skrjabini miyazakii]|uniref:Dehydrogenase/reductase SDR family member 1 n=1 Tax=Paragonimus skrjabini miyazakii TaxID=59628 RepID=A0A8S9YGM5_9TREM|nr:hypothetical protein EG68_11317 [Paragonimus skrjabini miyazakii]